MQLAAMLGGYHKRQGPQTQTGAAAMTDLTVFYPIQQPGPGSESLVSVKALNELHTILEGVHWLFFDPFHIPCSTLAPSQPSWLLP